MARKPNYKFERTERDRAKAAKKAERMKKRERRDEPGDEPVDTPATGGAPTTGSEPAASED
jgi:hypothetical protein